MSRIGSASWARKQGGRLGLRDRLLYIGAAVKSRLMRKLARRLPRSAAAAARLDLERLAFPESRSVRNAFTLCERVYEPWLLNHCIRTYFWGGLVGQFESIPVDLEALLIVSLYHDLGLATECRPDPDCECFAVRGSRYAGKVLADEGRGELAAVAMESISKHLNVAISPQEPALDYLLHQGASIDVVGWDAWKIHAAKQAVLNQYPRLDFKRKLIETLSAEAAAHPATRLALMIRFGFLDYIRRAPFRE